MMNDILDRLEQLQIDSLAVFYHQRYHGYMGLIQELFKAHNFKESGNSTQRGMFKNNQVELNSYYMENELFSVSIETPSQWLRHTDKDIMVSIKGYDGREMLLINLEYDNIFDAIESLDAELQKLPQIQD